MVICEYRVFISSALENMEEVRKAAIAGVSDARHIPISLDNFNPENASDWGVIRGQIENCHVYIMLLGATYGEVPADDEKSYFEIEFDLAERLNRYIMIFTLHWSDVLETRSRFAQDKRYRRELENTAKLERFYRKIHNGRHFYRTWRYNDIEIIRRAVGLALTSLPFEPNAPKGLIPATDTSSDAFIQSKLPREKAGDTKVLAETEEERQKRLHEAAMKFAGSIHGDDPNRAQNARALVRERIARRHGR